MKNKLIKLLPVIIILVVALWGMKSLFHPGFYTSHDGWHQVARLYYFNSALKDGQIPPRFNGDLLNGFGYPLFIYSYHLPWLMAEPLVYLGFSIFDAIKIVFMVTFFLSGITMYWFVSSIFGKKAGIISGIVYLYTPYRFVNILVRANIGEAVSFIFFPLIFLGLWQLAKSDKKWGLISGSIGIAGILLSHLMVVYLLFLPIFLFTLILFIETKNKIRYILNLFITGLLGFGLAGYYLLPAIYYQPITVFKDIYKGLYLNYFTPIKLLLYTPWGYGALGTNGEMSRQIGLAIWIIVLLTLITIIYLFFKKKNKFLLKHCSVFFVSFVFAFLMMTKISIGLWKMLQPVVLIDFPWRFLTVTTFCGSVLAGILIYTVKNPALKYIFTAILLMILFYTNRNHMRVNQYTNIPLDLYIMSELTTNTDDEYLPKWVNRQYARDEKTEKIINEKISITNLKQTSNRLLLTYYLPEDSQIDIHLMRFPGWKAFVDKKSVKIEDNGKGGIRLNIPFGSHSLEIRYMPTFTMRLGEIISLISLIIFLIILKRKVNS